MKDDSDSTLSNWIRRDAFEMEQVGKDERIRCTCAHIGRKYAIKTLIELKVLECH